jgi:mono/diheme cytochrome c family protein
VRKGPTTLVIVFTAMTGLLAACERPPSPDAIPEWSPADHDRAEENAKLQAAPAGSARTAAQQTTALVEAAWKSQCLRCHGPTGRGDGPEGPMNQTPDLTRGEWQAKLSDADIAAAIRVGKNKMPKFDLPDPVTTGLVARIRASRGK